MDSKEKYQPKQSTSGGDTDRKGDSIGLRSEEIQEILGTPPRWIIRRGNTILLVVLFILITGSFVFRYPELVHARVILLSENVPVQIAAVSGGQIEKIFVEDNRQVQQHEVLGVIKSTVNFEDAARLMAKLDSFEKRRTTPEKLFEISFPENYSLGKYQVYYTSFLAQFRRCQKSFRGVVSQAESSERRQPEMKTGSNFGIEMVLIEKFADLKNQLKVWEHDFVLKTPISGQVAFSGSCGVNRYVRSGDIIFTVVPDDPGRVSARILVAAADVEKVKPGQRVNIKPDNFPPAEYGILPGTVKNISKIPVENVDGIFYPAGVSLPDNLKTNFGWELPFIQPMQGNAEVVIRNQRLIELLAKPPASLLKTAK